MLGQGGKSLLLYSFILLLIQCTPVKVQELQLVHRTLEYQYDDDVYHLTFVTDSTLHWEAVKGAEAGLKGEEVYVAEWIDTDRLFITWGEKSGTGVSQILDFRQGKVFNHLLFGREPYAGEGTIKLLTPK